MRKIVIFWSGVAVLVLGYDWLKSTLGSVLFVSLALMYLIALRLVAEKYGR